MKITPEDQARIMGLTINGKPIKEMTAIEFCQYVLKKINGMKSDANVQALTMQVANFPGRVMSDDMKIDLIAKLERLGIEIK
jgi:hypothetical protein